MTDELLTRRDGGIVTLVLNRPHKLNAMTKPLWRALGEAFRSLHEDDTVRCIVLRGAGSKAFSPGNDIAEFETERSNIEQARAYGTVMHETLAAMRDCRHPSVALIEGICVGGGLEIAGSCDLRICGESSRFGAPINRLGLVMAYPEIDALLRLAGRATTLEILLEGRIFGAAEAKEKGLVTRVVSDDRVEEEAYAAATRIADGAPLVARWHKRFLDRLEQGTPLTAAELEEGYACFGTEDFRIGYRAFLAKEKPAFEGR
ncbi:enoyl-CoA hydratase/isomerase family protein [Azospirillum sp. RWY-5-1]|uniref:Enoyl-CoA hydratase/isomerase family protein n=1 Tax=Azospirillum oleiclasticum TaxID=2735135 RepID=A0ABX2T894_9PROT|nr:enoyl-CoA hydratase-related protein [Azospirillum oleiclasticum]NYZ12302.1 enoyl-CoA hydratase/isomerase family protein [Azospirillum oleiclasticum]NYZ19462.1 enoyl-CoA hydratase/isomerase family protein [Azospirillum oleiclasticum]